MRYIHVSKTVKYRKDALGGVIPTLIRGDGQTLVKGTNQRKRIMRLRQAAIRRHELRRAREAFWGTGPYSGPIKTPKRKNLRLTAEMLEDHGITVPEWARGIKMDLKTRAEAG